MSKRKLGMHHADEVHQKQFIKDIFVAIDADGNGTMELDELIKGLLSLNLSQDIDFAKQIINLFEEHKQVEYSKKDHRHRLYKEKVTAVSDRGQFKYSFKDFLTIFKTEKLGARIVSIINNDITLQAKLEGKQTGGNARSAPAAPGTVKKAANGDVPSAHSQTRGRADGSSKASHVDRASA
jgi:hypothetical protein